MTDVIAICWVRASRGGGRPPSGRPSPPSRMTCRPPTIFWSPLPAPLPNNFFRPKYGCRPFFLGRQPIFVQKLGIFGYNFQFLSKNRQFLSKICTFSVLFWKFFGRNGSGPPDDCPPPPRIKIWNADPDKEDIIRLHINGYNLQNFDAAKYTLECWEIIKRLIIRPVIRLISALKQINVDNILLTFWKKLPVLTWMIDVSRKIQCIYKYPDANFWNRSKYKLTKCVMSVKCVSKCVITYDHGIFFASLIVELCYASQIWL